MTLSEDATARLADVVALQPTKNAELQERWGLDSGSEVHGYLEDELGEYYYRDENSLIRATPEAADLVDVDPGVEGEGSPDVVRVPRLQAQAFSVLPGPDEDSESVVAVLHALRDSHGIDPDAEDVRSALRGLEQKGVAEVIRRTVPTFRLALARDAVTVEQLDDEHA